MRQALRFVLFFSALHEGVRKTWCRSLCGPLTESLRLVTLMEESGFLWAAPPIFPAVVRVLKMVSGTLEAAKESFV